MFRREETKDFKIIFISEYAEDSFRRRLGEESGIHFLPKPFSLKQLAAKVKDVLSGAGGPGAAPAPNKSAGQVAASNPPQVAGPASTT